MAHELTAEEKLRLAEVYAAGLITRSVMNRMLSGKITRAENQLLRSMLRMAGRGLARAPGTVAGAAVGLGRVAGTIAMRHPALAVIGTGAGIVYVAHQNRDEIQQLLQQGYEIISTPTAADPGEFGPVRPGPLAVFADPVKVKRAVSKANRAVKHGMKLLKAGTKARTGSKPGTLPKGAFKIAVKAAGLANPKTPSRIGKAKTKINKLARQIRKWW
jgi:hypothetical protein